MEEYHYIPEEEERYTKINSMVVYDPNYPPFYDVEADANSIANKAFGDDYTHDVEVLTQERLHAESCGCSQCLAYYEQRLTDVASQYVKYEE